MAGNKGNLWSLVCNALRNLSQVVLPCANADYSSDPAINNMTVLLKICLKFMMIIFIFNMILNTEFITQDLKCVCTFYVSCM